MIRVLEGVLIATCMAGITTLWVATMICEWVERKDNDRE